MINDMSRIPPRAIFKVRGIGVAVSVSTSISLRSDFDRLLVAHAETMFLINDDQADILDVLGVL